MANREIEEYVKANYGFKPRYSWFAHVKELNGLPVKDSPTRKDAEKRSHRCPESRVEVLTEALKPFNML